MSKSRPIPTIDVSTPPLSRLLPDPVEVTLVVDPTQAILLASAIESVFDEYMVELENRRESYRMGPVLSVTEQDFYEKAFKLRDDLRTLCNNRKVDNKANISLKVKVFTPKTAQVLIYALSKLFIGLEEECKGGYSAEGVRILKLLASKVNELGRSLGAMFV